MLENYGMTILFSNLLFCIGIAGIFINRKNLIIILMCVEVMLLAVNSNFIFLSSKFGDTNGQIVVFFIMTIAAAEAAIGLALLVVLFRERNTINVEDINQLKE